MVGRRTNTPRSRRTHRSPSCHAENLAKAVQQFLSHLDSPQSAPDARQVIRNDLIELLHCESANAQRKVGQSLSQIINNRTDALLRQRIASLVEVLSAWQESEPDQTLAVLAAVLAQTSRSLQPRDAAAQRAALRAVASTADFIRKHEAQRDAVARHVPTLVPVLHDALFDTRTGSSWSDGSSGTQSASDRSYGRSATRSSRLESRTLAFAALQALVEAIPTAILPFWPQLLPLTAGVARDTVVSPTRRTVATLLLYDEDIDIRSAAVSLVTALVYSARPFVRRRVHGPPGIAGPSFTPASERVVAACAALMRVVPSALSKERAPLVVPKLARLAADLALTAPPPVVPSSTFCELLFALQVTACGGAEVTDHTTRAAAGSALAVALSAGGDMICDSNALSSLCDAVVSVLTQAATDDLVPREELLGVLRSLFTLDAGLFLRVWRRLLDFFKNAVSRFGDIALPLHVVRAIEAYLNNISQSSQVDVDNTVVNAVCEVYCTLLSVAVHHPFHAVQISAISSLGLILRWMPVGSPDEDRDYVCSTAVNVGLLATPRDVLLEVVDKLQTIALSVNNSTAVRAAAAKALGGIRADAFGEHIIMSTMSLLDHISHESNADDKVILRGRAFASFATVFDHALQHNHLPQSALTSLTNLVANACTYLRTSHLELLGNCSAAMRANIEACRIAAVLVITSFLCVAQLGISQPLASSEITSGLVQNSFDLLRTMISDDNESANTRCSCCRALGRVVSAKVDVNECSINKHRQEIYSVLQSLIGNLKSARIEATAAKAVTKIIIEVERGLDANHNLIRQCGRSLVWSAEQSRSLEVPGKDRGQYLHLQGCMSELVCTILNQTRGQMKTSVYKDAVREYRESLIGAVCLHHNVSRYVTGTLITAQDNLDLEDILSKQNLRGCDVLPLEAKALISTVFALANAEEFANDKEY